MGRQEPQQGLAVEQALAGADRLTDFPEPIRNALPLGLTLAYDEACHYQRPVTKHLGEHDFTTFEVRVTVERDVACAPIITCERLGPGGVRLIDLLAD